jgi:CheY-like chemotaxis protein
VSKNTKKDGGRPRALVADDDASARSAMETLLTAEGFDVLLAEDGTSAVARFEEVGPDVVVTDLRMPGMDGL